MKNFLLSLALGASFVLSSQDAEPLTYGGLIGSFSNTKIDNGRFHRGLTTDANGMTQSTFSNTESHKLSGTGFGFAVDHIGRKWTFGLDMQYPLNQSMHWIYLKAAKLWRIKKFGISLGLSIMAKPKGKQKGEHQYTTEFNGITYKSVIPKLQYTDTGYYYIANHDRGGWGLDIGILYALNDQMTFRTGIAPLLVGFDAPSSDGDKRWDNDAKGFRWESAFVWTNGKFGFFARYTYTKITRNYYVNDLINHPGGSSVQEIQLIPEMTSKAGMFTIGIMLPPEWFGNVRHTRGTISATND